MTRIQKLEKTVQEQSVLIDELTKRVQQLEGWLLPIPFQDKTNPFYSPPPIEQKPFEWDPYAPNTFPQVTC